MHEADLCSVHNQASYALHALPPELSYTLAAAVLNATKARGAALESESAAGIRQ